MWIWIVIATFTLVFNTLMYREIQWTPSSIISHGQQYQFDSGEKNIKSILLFIMGCVSLPLVVHLKALTSVGL